MKKSDLKMAGIAAGIAIGGYLIYQRFFARGGGGGGGAGSKVVVIPPQVGGNAFGGGNTSAYGPYMYTPGGLTPGQKALLEQQGVDTSRM